MTRPKALTEAQWKRNIMRDMAVQERRGRTEGVKRGTTAQRDARYGAPATDAERVALANARIVWFNTDFGWEESYFAVTGLTGLTVPGLVAGTASGWYPIGPGPEVSLNATTGGTATAGQYVGGFNGNVARRGGATWFSNDTLGPLMLVAGVYDLSLYTVQQAGTGTADYHARLLNAANSVIRWQSNITGTPLNSLYFTRMEAQFPSVYVEAGSRLVLYCSNGALSIHQTSGVGMGRGQLFARYVRPPLVSD